MIGSSHRIPPHVQGPFGTRITRSKPVSFRFNNQRLIGVSGDTLSSALLAQGVTTFGINSRTRMPQGFFSLTDQSTPSMVSLRRGRIFIPYPNPNDVGLREGIDIQSTDTWKNSFLRRVPFCQRFTPFHQIPSVPLADYQDNFEHIHLQVDVLVIGGGLAGIAAAEIPAREGLEVLLAESAPFFGGISDAYDGTLDGIPSSSWIEQQITALEEKSNVRLRRLMSVIHLSGNGEALILERISETGLEKTPPDYVRARLWFVKAKAVILATGAHEKPLVFQDNAAVGVVSACSARLLLRRYGVAVGKNVVLVSSSDEGQRTALDFKQAGIGIEQLVDLRLQPAGILLDRAKSEGIRMTFASSPYKISQTHHGRALDSLTLRNRLREDGPPREQEILCDTVVTSGGWQPNLRLARTIGADFAFDDDSGSVAIRFYPSGFFSAGAASGIYNAREVLQDGLKAGADAVAFVLQRPSSAYEYRDYACTIIEDTPPENVPDSVEDGPSDRAFINEHRTITVEDVQNFCRTSDSANTHALYAAYYERDAFEKPVNLGTLAGQQPKRSTARSLEAADIKGAVYSTQDGWKIVEHYALENESLDQSIAREVRSVSSGAVSYGINHGQLVSLNGPDVTAFLHALQEISRRNARMPQKEGNCLSLEGIHLHILPLNEQSLLCFSLRGGRDLYALVRKHLSETGLRVAVSREDDRWAKVLMVGNNAQDVFADHPVCLQWPLPLTAYPAYLVLSPVGQSAALYEKIAARSLPFIGLKAFEQLLFENGDLNAEQYSYFWKTGGILSGLVAQESHLHIPAGTHLFKGTKPASERTSQYKPQRTGYVLASHYSYQLGRSVSLAVFNDTATKEPVHFRAMGDLWQALPVPIPFTELQRDHHG